MNSKNSEIMLSSFLGDLKKQGFDQSWGMAGYASSFKRPTLEKNPIIEFIEKETGIKYAVLKDVFQTTSARRIQ